MSITSASANKEHGDVWSDYISWLGSWLNWDGRTRLFQYLADYPFEVVIKMDENRVCDAIDMRSDFILEFCDDHPLVSDMDPSIHPISLLEILAVMASMIENDIMWNPDVPDRRHIRFDEMLRNAGLDIFDDGHWGTYGGELEVEPICDRIVRRKYGTDGKGGLFPLDDPQKNQRRLELWYQANAYCMERYVIGEEW